MTITSLIRHDDVEVNQIDESYEKNYGKRDINKFVNSKSDTTRWKHLKVLSTIGSRC